MNQSGEQVCLAIAADFKLQKLSYEAAAKKLGQSVQTVYNRISSKKYFSLPTARRWAEAFEYNVGFLTSGTGELKVDSVKYLRPINNSRYESFDDVLASLADRLIHLIGDPDITQLWRAAILRDMDTFIECEEKLVERMGARARIPSSLHRKLEFFSRPNNTQ